MSHVSQMASALRWACVSLALLCLASDLQQANASCWPPSQQANVTYKNRPDKQVAMPTIQLVLGGWDSAAISTEIARILLSEKAGFPIQMWPTADPNAYWGMVGKLQKSLNMSTSDEAVYWAMANTTNLVYLETWNENTAAIKKYLFDKRTVASLGVLGTSGRQGFYIPSYLSDQYPSLYSYQVYTTAANNTEVVDLFRCDKLGVCETHKPTLWFSSSSYTDAAHTEALLRNIGMDFYVNYTGSEPALDKVMLWHMDRKLPVIFYSYRPYWIHHALKLTKVLLPPNPCDCDTHQCFVDATCDWGALNLNKAASAGFEAHSPEAYFLLRSLVLDNELIEIILTDMQGGMSMTDATCKWLKNNEEVWTSWIKPVVRNTCPRDCIHGHCVDTTCMCDKGYRGSACEQIYKLEGHALDASFNGSSWILGIVIVLLGAWTSLIILEHTVIPSKTARSLDSFWIIPSAVCLAVAGDWCMVAILAASVDLDLPVHFHWSVFVIGPALSSLLSVAAFWLARKTVAVSASGDKKHDDDDGLNVSKEKKQKKPVQDVIAWKTMLHPLMFVCGLLLTASSVVQREAVLFAIKIDATIQYNIGYFILSVIQTYVLVTLAAIVYFHVIRSRLRLLGFFVMASGLLLSQIACLLSITWKYKEGNAGSGGVSDIAIRMSATACTALTCFLLMLLNVNRLKLSRSVLDNTLRQMEVHLDTVKQRMQHEIDWAHTQLDLINFTRPQFCKQHWLHSSDNLHSEPGPSATNLSNPSNPSGPNSRNSNSNGASVQTSLPGSTYSLADSWTAGFDKSKAGTGGDSAVISGSKSKEKESRETRLNLLKELLDDPVCAEFIKDVMHKRVCVELVEFYMEVQRYKQIQDSAKRAARALFLYEWYIKDGSKFQVNVSDAFRQSIDSVMLPLMADRASSPSSIPVSLTQSRERPPSVDSQSRTSAQTNNHQMQQQPQSRSPSNTSQSAGMRPPSLSSSSACPLADTPLRQSSTSISVDGQVPGVSSRLFDECAREVLQLIDTNGFYEYRQSADFFPCYVAHQMLKANAQWLNKRVLEDRKDSQVVL